MEEFNCMLNNGNVISKKAKERFCKDCNIPIKLFDEPYFTDRMHLYDKFYHALRKWKVFVDCLNSYACEQDYFEEYNKVKDAAIDTIKNNDVYQKFNNEDMNKYAIKNQGMPAKDIFKPSFDGRGFISIDMHHANFSALHYYSPEIFKMANGELAESWEEFISLFTTNKHIINSKYIRQVILGNCNPKRHITYEKYMMDKLLSDILLTEPTIKDNIVFFSNDEIVIDITDIDDEYKQKLISELTIMICEYNFQLKMEIFTLYKIRGLSDGYLKIFTKDNTFINEADYEFKCINNFMLPFTMRRFLGQEITENDKVFVHEGMLAKFINAPEIEFGGEQLEIGNKNA